MGTYYTLGIIHRFTARTERTLSKEEWIKLLDSRLDTSLFDLEILSDSGAKGILKANVFSDNITGFYRLLKDILGADRNDCIDYYEKEFGTDLANYQSEYSSFKIQTDQGYTVIINFDFALLFIEGKVLAEEFYSEPLLMNWLFRNSRMENPLSGCVISDVIG